MRLLAPSRSCCAALAYAAAVPLPALRFTLMRKSRRPGPGKRPPHLADVPTDQRPEHRPQREQQGLVQESEQVVALSLGEDGAVIAHELTWLIEVVGAQAGPGNVQRQLDGIRPSPRAFGR